MRAALACLALVLTCACSSAHRGAPLVADFVPADIALQRGQIVFMQSCHKCHPGGEAGLGPALNDKPLPKFLMRFQVRHGLGVMPSFTQAQIPDQDLDDLVDFLVAYRQHG